jgi:hypothetical protein
MDERMLMLELHAARPSSFASRGRLDEDTIVSPFAEYLSA